MKTTTTAVRRYMREISIAMFLQIQSDTYIADFWKTNRTKFAERQKAASCLGPISSKITLTKGKGENERAGEERRRTRGKSIGCTLSFYTLWLL